MPRSEKTEAAQAIVSEASAALNLDLVEKLAQPLAEYLLGNYTARTGKIARTSRPWPALLPFWTWTSARSRTLS